MVNNVEFVSGLSPSSSGREIKEYIKELAFAKLAAKIKIFVRSVLLI